MTAKPSEATNFFWHCLVAAKLMDELPDVTVRNAHFVHAVRKATVCSVGAQGVRYASDAARIQREVEGKKPWGACGLVKEHAVPVSEIGKRVRVALREAPATTPLPLSEAQTRELPPTVVADFRQHPRAWQVASVVREWTLLAWITPAEDARFDDKTAHGGISIRKCMPVGWTESHGRLARYDACRIVVSPI